MDTGQGTGFVPTPCHLSASPALPHPLTSKSADKTDLMHTRLFKLRNQALNQRKRINTVVLNSSLIVFSEVVGEMTLGV